MLSSSQLKIFVIVSADPRVAWHKEHFEQVGRVHGVVFPRIHLRAVTITAQ